ncbi:hypothetical protein [Sphingobium chlorophenolicum]|uniref:Uncharacterized protein n=1 Tax=Sphingobium chlorophenolicum TaxID=46429 RepID=A0A081RJE8_SPHCR|nr:hypothetical protein [Sphingobium chlorophenolicum]KEQ55321.1 hypothetical protein BV95_00484 [Sphingobium chlorophenolicum]
MIALLMMLAAPQAEDVTECIDRLITKNYSQKVPAAPLARKITNTCMAPMAPPPELKEITAMKWKQTQDKMFLIVLDGINNARAEKGITLKH